MRRASTLKLPDIEAFSAVENGMAMIMQVESKPLFDGLWTEVLTKMVICEAGAEAKTKTAIRQLSSYLVGPRGGAKTAEVVSLTHRTPLKVDERRVEVYWVDYCHE